LTLACPEELCVDRVQRIGVTIVRDLRLWHELRADTARCKNLAANFHESLGFFNCAHGERVF
jgi:hypothetical protein